MSRDDLEYKNEVIKYVKLARRSFYHFVMLIHPPGGWFIMGQLHEFLISMVQDVVDGVIGKRNVVSVPPQHGKSTILSILATAWVIGVKPGLQVAITGYSHELTTDFSKAVKAIVRSRIYRLIFPGLVVLDKYDKNDTWSLSNGSTVRAKSVGKALTGRKVDWLVIDDPHKGRREAKSPTARKRVVEWYFADCVTRLAPGASVFIIQTRWHKQDLIGRLTSEQYEEDMLLHGRTQEIFQVTNLEAICVHPEKDPLRRPYGACLFTEVRTKEFLENIKLSIPAYEWESQYQGNPIAAASGQVDTDKIRRIEFEDVPQDIEWVRAWDLALSTKKTSDFTAGALCAYDKRDDHFYIIDIWHGKKAWAEMKPVIVNISLRDKEEWGVNRIAVESVTGFKIGASELRTELAGEVRVEEKNPKGDKLMCAQPWFNKIEAHKVSMVRGGWNKVFIEELQIFPAAEHDDTIDAVSRAWECFEKSGKLTYA